MACLEELDDIISWKLKDFRITKKEPLTDKNLVLDIDSTMVKTYKKMAKFYVLDFYNNQDLMVDRKRIYRTTIYDTSTVGSPDITEIWGVKRPGLMRFLRFASEYFNNIFIWTSGLEQYAREIRDILFKDLPPPRAILSQDFCLQRENDDFYKPLSKLYKVYGHFGVNAKNTIMIDDLNENMGDNPDNGIVIPAYDPKADLEEIRSPDNALEIIQNWLETDEVRDAADIRKVKKPSFN